MHVPTWPTYQPGLEVRVAVRGVVVDDAMNVGLDGHGLVDLAQERQELLMTMAWLARRKTAPLSTLNAAKRVVVPCRL